MFERNKEEDPLAGLRGEGKATKVEVSERAGLGSGGGGGGGLGETAILGLWFMFTVVVATLVLYLSESDAVDDPIKRAERGEVRGFDKHSLLVPENLRKALAKVSAAERGGITENVRVDPTAISANVRRGDFKERIVRVNTGFEVDERDFGESEDKGGHAADVPVDAPTKIVAAIAKRLNRPVDETARNIDYMVVSFRESNERIEGSWSAFLANERPSLKNWHSDLAADDVHLSGEPSAADRAERLARERLSEQRTQVSERYRQCAIAAQSSDAHQVCQRRYDRDREAIERAEARLG